MLAIILIVLAVAITLCVCVLVVRSLARELRDLGEAPDDEVAAEDCRKTIREIEDWRDEP